MDNSKNNRSSKIKSLKRQNKKNSKNSNSKVRRTAKTRHSEDNEPNNYCETMEYYPSVINDQHDDNTSSEDLENVDDNSNEQEDVFANVGRIVKEEGFSDSGDIDRSVINQVFVESLPVRSKLTLIHF